MNSQISISNNKTSNKTLPFSNTPAQKMFESSPFVVQSKNDNSQQPRLNVSLIQAEKYGHHLNKNNLGNQSASTVVQPKLNNQPIQLGRRKRPAGGNSTGQPNKRQRTSNQTQPNNNRRGKQQQLENQQNNNPNKTPMETLQSNPNLLVKKGDPKLSGEHSPSVVNINKTTDNKMGVPGRNSYNPNKPVNSTVPENRIPTMHFQTISGKQIVPGAEAHSILTSLRGAAGVGERTKQPFDQVLDKTNSAYPGAKLLSNNQPMKVDIRQKGAQQSLVRHPVSPRIGQSIINIWHRNSVKAGRPSTGNII